MAFDYLWAKCPAHRAIFRNSLPLGLGVLSTVLTILAHDGSAGDQYWGNSPWLTAQLMLRICWEYVVSLAMPLDLNHRYIYDASTFTSDIRVGLGCLVLVGLGILAWRQPLGKPMSRFAVLWIGVLMLPVANLLPFAIQRADRYLYLPSVMIYWLLSQLGYRLWQRIPNGIGRHVYVGVICLAMVPLIVLTWQRNDVWANGGTLWRDHLTDYPRSVNGLLNLGVYLYEHNDYAPAARALQQALVYQPSQLKANVYLARTYFAQGEHQKAIDTYWRAINFRPRDKRLFYHLGETYEHMKRDEAAVSAYEAAIEIDPAYLRAQFNRGRASLRLSDYAGAREAFEAVLRRYPTHTGAIRGVCRALAALGEKSTLVDQCPK